MDEHQKEIFIKEIKQAISGSIDLRMDITDEQVKDSITSYVFERSKKTYLTIREKRELVERIFNSMRKLDILQPLIDDKSITEIMINGANDIFIEKHGRTYRYDICFESKEKLEDVIQSIVSKVNRAVNEASPIVDARLKDGSRVNVVLPPVALNGPIMTIRKFPEKPFAMEQLVKNDSITDKASKFLKNAVEAKYNIFISGGTGSGKTTFLNALSNFIPSDERIITIEDSAELQIRGIQNIVKMETRNSNTEGKGEITIRDLIRASLRMRPERIIVGEVRGAEALDMLAAMNTGHEGSLSTGHSNSSHDMLSRLETMVLSGSKMPLEAIRRQIASAIDIIIHLSRLRDRTRRVTEISEVSGYADGEVVLNPLFIFEEEGENKDGKVLGTLKRTENQLKNIAKFKMAGIKNNLL